MWIVCNALLLQTSILSSAPFIACSHVILRQNKSWSCILRFRGRPKQGNTLSERNVESLYHLSILLPCIYWCRSRSGDSVNSNLLIVALWFAESERLVLFMQRYSILDNMLSNCSVLFRSWRRVFFGGGAQEKSNGVEMRR